MNLELPTNRNVKACATCGCPTSRHRQRRLADGSYVRLQCLDTRCDCNLYRWTEPEAEA